MLNIKNVIQWYDPLTHLHRVNQTIFGINSNFEVIQVDTRNHVIEKIISFTNQKYEHPLIRDVQFLKSQLGEEYYFSFDKQIISGSGKIVETSNNKADFAKGLDGKNNFFIFVKFHKLHNKYSLNVLRAGKQKKILQLFDSPINHIHLIMDQTQKSILVETAEKNVGLIYGQHWQQQETFQKANRFLYDSFYSYILTGNDRRSSPDRSEFHSGNQKIRVQAYQKNKITKGKGYSQFQFYLNRYPLKIDCFQNDLIIAFDTCMEIYDIRKIVKPFQIENQKNIKDFYYEPNLQRIYLSSQKGLHIFQYK